MCLALLSLCTACPEMWGREGVIDRALEQDVQNSLRRPRRPEGCPMSDEKWARLCDAPTASPQCPSVCRVKR